MDLKNLKEINNETLTKIICNKGFICNLNNLSRTNFSVVGQVGSPQSLTAHTAMGELLFLDFMYEEDEIVET